MTADTGCQSVLVGIKINHRLGFKKLDLIPMKTKMSAVNRDVIPILGAVILRRLSGKSGSGSVIETAQICYMTEVIEGAYLSREACTTLGIIPIDFPRNGSATQQPMSVSSAAASPRDEEWDCSCPIHTKPPPLPTALPFTATDANRTALQNWILGRYRSSTFNTCECQTLPLMEGPPLDLHVDPEAKPIAVHKPIPVPLHWQQEVKQSIDRDANSGFWRRSQLENRLPGAIEWSQLGRKTANHDPQWTCRCSTNMLFVKHIRPNPRFTKQRCYLQGPRRQLPMLGYGYHSVPIREKDRHLSTFITPWGQYRYETCPQGYAASQD